MTLTETSMASSTLRRRGRDLVQPALFDRLAARVATDTQVDLDLAERICDQALAFLEACAENPDQGLSPSPAVDVGWHTFILYTREYAAFCDRVAGRYIHHMPTDGGVGRASASLMDTVATIEACGLAVDDGLWATDCDQRCRRCKQCKNCHQCHGGCWNSP